MYIHQPKNTKRADKLYAFLSHEADGTEGVVACATAVGMTPLVCMDEGGTLELMRGLAKEFRKMSGKNIVLAEFMRTNTTSI